jgi:hypothetical protein
MESGFASRHLAARHLDGIVPSGRVYRAMA